MPLSLSLSLSLSVCAREYIYKYNIKNTIASKKLRNLQNTIIYFLMKMFFILIDFILIDLFYFVHENIKIISKINIFLKIFYISHIPK